MVLFPDPQTVMVTTSGETDKSNNSRALVKRLQNALLRALVKAQCAVGN